MFDQHTRVIARLKGLAVYPRVLLDDRKKRQNDDHAPQPMLFRVLEGERQHGQCLARTRWRGDPETPWRPSGGVKARLVNLPARDIHGRRFTASSEFENMPVKALEELFLEYGRRGALLSRHIGFGVEVVGVDQTGKKHPDQEFLIERCFETSTVSEEFDHRVGPGATLAVGVEPSRQCLRLLDRIKCAVPDLILRMRYARQ